MKKLYLRLLFSIVTSNNDRIKAVKIFFLAFFFCCLSYAGYSQVSITAASGGTSICSSTAVGGSAPMFTTLGQITITESTVSDFAGPGIDVMVLNAPAGWQFNASALPTFNFLSGANVTAVTGTITGSVLTVSVTVNGTTAGDKIWFTGLQIQATSAGAAAGYIYPSSSTGVAGITTGTSGSDFGNLSLNPVTTPSVTISATPGSTICSGTNTTFSVTATGGGTLPSYQWSLNGGAIATGATYSSNTLASGNYITCTMTSSAACVTAGTAISNIVVMTVNPLPSAITGVANVCPAATTALSDPTSSGSWSSGNTTIAIVGPSGIVTGVSAGSVLISYTVAGCSASTSVTVNNIPITPVLTPSVTSICNGNNISLVASGIATPPTVISENFNSSLSPWTVDNTGSSGTVPACTWNQYANNSVISGSPFNSPDFSGFAAANGDATFSSSSITSTRLISPIFSLVGYASATLTFQQTYESWHADSTVELDISTNGGATWTTMYNWLGTSVGTQTSFITETFPLTAYLGLPNLQIRFFYNSNWGYYWAVDNVLITGTSSGVVPTWSPTTYLFSDPGLTTPYATGTATNTVYMNPTTVTTTTIISYTATASNLGCTSVGTNTVTIYPAPGVINGNTNVCAGLTSTLSDAVTGGAWSSSNTSVATVAPGTGVVSGVSVGSAVISYVLSGGCYTTVTVAVNPIPSAISGTLNVCAGSTTNLSASPGGGTWSSSSSPIATVLSGIGYVSGVSAGTAIITYSLGAGCNSTASVVVNPSPSVIAGPTSVCTGSTITLSDGVAGGTWSCSNTSLATITPGTGILTGLSAGPVTVTYELTGSCTATLPVTIYALPTAITGTTNVCQGLTTTLSDSPSGGIWSSSNTNVATVISGTGIVTGTSAGTANITYTIGSSCIATTSVIVNPLPLAISGPGAVCAGSLIPLSDITAGGAWSSSNTGLATVVSATAMVTGVSAGTAVITYTLGSGCIATKSVTVNPLPASISGINAVCIGLTTNLSDISAGGTWSSGNTSVATIVTGSGFVSAISPGISTITYTLGTGCIAVQTVTVNSLPSAISGTTNVCVGLTTTLSDMVSGGSWSSSNNFYAQAVLATGVVTGMNAGIVSITYTLGTSCIATTTLQVNPLSQITGITNVCQGLTTNLSDATVGGTWSSSNTAFATVSGTGVVSGITAGTITINYILPTGCTATTSVIVNPIPAPISGNINVCLSSNTTLSDGGGGTWSSSNTSVATIGLNNGIVFGQSIGTAPITYSLSAGCIATTSVIVNPLPASVTGAANVCVGSSISLSDVTTGGTWSSSNTSYATAGTGGVVTGVSAGAVIVTYTLPTGCISIKNITVNPLPSAISGITNVCLGLTTTLSDATIGGTWSTGNSTIATITAVGTVTGATAGTAVITYGIGTGCVITTSVVVNPLPSSITGAQNVCMGFATALSDVTDGGAWSSSNTAIATINASGSGIVTSISQGTIVITYTLGTGCITTTTVTINPLPNAITGNTTVCVGLTAILSDGGGGTWSSGSSSVATVVSITGVVTGASSGNANITYTLPTGCIATTSVLVNPLPAVITGTLNVCNGFSTTLSDVTPGGAWSSSNTAIATITVSGSGIVSTLSPGTTVITYTLGTGCIATKSVTVNPLPNAIAGTTTVCVGLTTALSDAGSGTWSSSTTSIATVGPTTGIVTGISAGNVNITYSLPTGCITTASLTVNPLPAAITGTPNVCYSSTTSLSDGTAGGGWSSSNTLVAAIDPSAGFISTISPGTTIITYTLGTGCIATKTFTVSPLPSVIVGQATLCVSSNATLSDGTSGGTWSSSNSAIATIGISNGIVTGASSGSVVIFYTLATGCSAIKSITVNALPPGISGITNICYGSTTTLSDVNTGGTWSSSNTAVATINVNSGVVIGTLTGTSLITYAVDTGCAVTTLVTVNSLPSSISGANSICVGQTTPMSDAGGGTWSSSNTDLATIGLSNGIVTGVGPGTLTVIYTLTTGCTASKNITVNAMPSVISGITSICLGGTSTLSDAVPGGTWSSSNTNVAVIDVNLGVVEGGIPGTSTITYTMPGSCATTVLLTVNTLPSGVSGTSSLCVGLTTALSDGTSGGSWSCSNTSFATVSSAGVVSGLSPGVVSIYYTLPTGCAANRNITIYASPSSITGTTNLCVGYGTTLSDAVSGGTWSSSNTIVAMIDPAAGIVTTISPGTTVISYSMPGGCAATILLTVNALPSNISGAAILCVGLTTALSDGTTGGTWSISNTSLATVSNTGVFSGLSPGAVVVYYTLATGCAVSENITLYSSPSSITGITNVCLGTGTTLSDAVSGGIWSSSNTTIVTIDPVAGTVSTISPGTSIITYSMPGGCTATTSYIVNQSPSGIIGNVNTCVGLTTALSDLVAGGVWSSSNTSVATITSATGFVKGVSPGATVVTYSLGAGCTTTTTVTVNAVPSSITGITNVCLGSETTLSDAVSGGTWSSSNTAVASADVSLGIVTGMSAGSAIISYSIVSGCASVTSVTVNPIPSSITGNTITCVGLTTTLSDAVSGGTWSSSNTSIATVTSGTGIVKGITAGTVIITYSLSGGCITTTSVTINPLPSGIAGAVNICLGSVTYLSDTIGGGSWSSSNTSVAMVVAGSGIVTGLSPGTSIITYSIVSGCATTTLVTVNTLPSSITGTTTVCIGVTTHLSDATAGGTWSSGSTAVATVVTSSGVVTGVTAGVASIIYTLSTGCTANRNVTVSPLPTGISGNTNVCLGYTSALSDGTAGGNWVSSNTSVAIIDPALGIVTGLSPGSSSITYSLGAGCTATIPVSVISAPAAITGATNFCIGLVIALSDATSGGVWSSNNTAIATVVPGTGHVTGFAAGTVVIAYSIGSGCTATTSVIVNPLPSAISGNTNVCIGSISALSDATSGGTWSSSNTVAAIIGAGTGVVIGLSVGTSAITYSLGAGCTATASVSVNSLPSSITGAATVCIGLTTNFSDATAGGTWSSGNTSVATIDPVTGTIYGITPGIANIVYTLPSGCTATRNITVTSLPSAISGNTNVCIGTTTILSDLVSGGVWSSSNTAFASVGTGTGTVFGASVGIPNITYTISAGCFVTTSVTVMSLSPAITGALSVCIGSATTLSDASGGGAWISGNTSIAVVDPVLGIVTGITSGSAIIAYTASTGCTITTPITVDPLPSAITGAANVCVGSGTTLSDAGGGTWSSSSTGVATIGLTTGIFSGLSVGAATITYTLGTGCIIATTITVIPLPLPIAGMLGICSGSATTLSDPASGGTWSSHNTSVATIGLNTGVVTGAASGIAAIYYMLGTGCTTATTVTVNPLPSAISGVNIVCVGATTTLNDIVSSGTWSSSNSSVAIIGLTTGIVTGVSAGTATITYTLNTGCIATISVTVNSLPTSIIGTTSVCAGSTTMLSNASGGGTWASSNTSIATVIAGSGIVSGIISGTAAIIYKLGTGCLITTTVTVNPLPAAITGSATVCAGSETTLSDGGGGDWSSSNTAIATIGLSSGVFTGVTSGSARITYMIATGCMATVTVTVNPLPAIITGITGVCAGATTALSDATLSGTWSSSNTFVATISITSGIVSGLSSGTATITYAVVTGCIITNTVTVYSLPSAIAGGTSVCVGSTTTLSDGGGGVWSGNNTAVATIASPSGVVFGLSSGVTVITYTLGTGCLSVTSVTVDPLPSAITGLSGVCLGSVTNLSDAGGGTWSSNNTGVAIVGLTTGFVTGTGAGAAIITYQLITGCIATNTVTVYPLPSAISGITSVCAASSTILSDGISGGTWSSSNTGIATIALTNGLVTGVAPGSVNITYTLSGGCGVSANITVLTIPTVITGLSHVCLGATTMLSDLPAGGVWSSDNTTVATINPVTGIVSGVAPGNAVIGYSLGTGCSASFTETVNPVLPVTGTMIVCAGETTNLSDAIAGGTWSSNNTPVAIVSSSGIVTGVSGGFATILYTSPAGCTEAALVTVNPLSPVNGMNQVCVGATTLLGDAALGGAWSSSNTTVATISSSGLVSGITVGTTTINYLLSSGCAASTTVTVNPIPAAITGNTVLCVSATTYLSDPTGSGTWSNSSSFGILTIGGTTGAVTGLAIGSEPITYTAAGCIAITTVTVQSPPSGISGLSYICSGLTTTLSDGTPGGAWSTANTSVATINQTTGYLTAVSAGVTAVTYTTGVGCLTVAAITVDLTPLPVNGATAVCAGGATTSVSDATPGGAWASAGVTISPTGLVTGYTAGTATITYTLPTGCETIAVISVDALPSAITGTMSICPGVPSALSDATPGGVWSSGNTSVATINEFNGTITGITAGAVLVTYTNSAGCSVIALVTVNPLPLPISGNTKVCVASSIVLSDASGGGVWTSGNTATALAGLTTGIVTGVATGIAAITYTMGSTGCITTASVTVNSLPIGIAGVNHVCLGDPTTLSDYPLGGVWTSANTSIAVIDSFSGVVIGLSVNVTTITYTLLSTGCIRTTPLTVNPFPQAIIGATTVCAGSSTTLSDASGGGVWSSGNTTIAMISPGAGIVTGVSASSAGITYTLATGCTVSTTVTIDPLPAVYNVTGGGAYCALDTGVHIGLSSSATGFNYKLYLGTTLINTQHGTGAVLDFGLQTAAGTYTVIAVNNTTGCSADMSGTAVIIITAPAIPSVSITVDTGYTVCTGTVGTFIAMPVNGGSSPLYQWKVNGTNTATTNPYYYVPSNGDIVTCTMTTSLLCVTALTASASYTVAVTAYQTPAVSIVVTPGDTVCAGTPVTFIPTPVFSGTAPVYTWMRNGTNVATGSSYNYIPANGDSVYCTMISNYPCIFTTTAWSNDIAMSVAPLMSPSVTITAVPGSSIMAGQADTLIALAVNAGASPSYQWYINGIAVPGATSATYISSNFSNDDSVSCIVAGSDICSGVPAHASVIIAVNNVGVQQIIAGSGDVQLVPNPNKGEFTIKGTLDGSASGIENVSLEVTDMLGQVVYKDKITVTNGKMNSHITLSSTLANGMYMLTLRAATENKIFHFVIEQ